MAIRSRPSRRRGGPALLTAAVAAVCSLLVPSTALAATSTRETPPADDAPATAALLVTVTPLVGDGRDDGDLVLADEDTGLVALFFSPTAPAEQRAVHEVRVRNTGEVPLSDVAITDDQMGTILDGADGTTLAPGEELVTQAEMTFTFDQVTTGRGGLVRTTTTASATADGDTVVSGTAETRVELVAVLAESGLDADATDAPDSEDAAAEDAPTTGTAVDAEAEDEDEPVAAQLPATGLDAPVAMSLAVAFLAAGAALLLVSRPRTAAAARPRRRPGAVWRRRG